MQTFKCFCFIASVMMLVAIPLLRGAIILSLRAQGGSNILFAEHTIADNFSGARSVYATDVDDDGDVDVLGAAGSADDITWWENDGNENFTEHTIADNFDSPQSVGERPHN